MNGELWWPIIVADAEQMSRWADVENLFLLRENAEKFGEAVDWQAVQDISTFSKLGGGLI